MGNNQGIKLGKKIKALRLKIELSQDEFARKADIPYTSLTKVKTGIIKKLSVFVILKTAKALGVNIKD